MKTSSRPKAQPGVDTPGRKLVCGWCGHDLPPDTAGRYCREEHRALARQEQIKQAKHRYALSERGRLKNQQDKAKSRLRQQVLDVPACTMPRSWGRALDDLRQRVHALEVLIVTHGPCLVARTEAEALHLDIVTYGCREREALRLLIRCLEMRVDVGVPAGEEERFLGYLRYVERYHAAHDDTVRLGRTLVVHGNLLRNLGDYFAAADVFGQAYRVLKSVSATNLEAQLWEHRALVLGGRTVAIDLMRPSGAEIVAQKQVTLAERIDDEFVWLETRREIACFDTEALRFDKAEREIEEMNKLSRRFSGHLFDLANQRTVVELAFKQGDVGTIETEIARFRNTAMEYKSARHVARADDWRRRLAGLPPVPRFHHSTDGLVYVPMCYFYNEKGHLHYK